MRLRFAFISFKVAHCCTASSLTLFHQRLWPNSLASLSLAHLETTYLAICLQPSSKKQKKKTAAYTSAGSSRGKKHSWIRKAEPRVAVGGATEMETEMRWTDFFLHRDADYGNSEREQVHVSPHETISARSSANSASL